MAHSDMCPGYVVFVLLGKFATNIAFMAHRLLADFFYCLGG